LILFPASGANADKAIRRAAALIQALPDTVQGAYGNRVPVKDPVLKE
jgi:hypothetical protein